MRNTVSLVRNKDPVLAVKKVVEVLDAKSLLSPDDRVLIKPNYLSAKHPSTGVTTDTRVVSAIIQFVKSCGVRDITVGDGGWSDTDAVFDAVGIREVTRREGVKLVDLNVDERVRTKIPGATALRDVDIAKTVIDSDSIINVPKLKIHGFAKVTLSIKNLMGAILPKSIIHTRLDEKLVDLASVIRPKLNIVDGIVGCERSEHSGTPVQMDLIIGGMDMVAVDAVGSLVMGVDPNEVGYITLAAKRGLGTMDLREVEIVGERIEDVRKKFNRK